MVFLIKELRKLSPGVRIQVDGGVNLMTAGKLAKLDVNYLNSGSFVGEAKNPQKTLRKLEKAFLKASGRIK